MDIAYGIERATECDILDNAAAATPEKTIPVGLFLQNVRKGARRSSSWFQPRTTVGFAP
jgi:hypothetical protein